MAMPQDDGLDQRISELEQVINDNFDFGGSEQMVAAEREELEALRAQRDAGREGNSGRLYEDEIGEYYKDEEAYESGEGICYISSIALKDQPRPNWWDRAAHIDSNGRRYWSVSEILAEQPALTNAWTKIDFLFRSSSHSIDHDHPREVLAYEIFQRCGIHGPNYTVDHLNEKDWADILREEYKKDPSVVDLLHARAEKLEKIVAEYTAENEVQRAYKSSIKCELNALQEFLEQREISELATDEPERQAVGREEVGATGLDEELEALRAENARLKAQNSDLNEKLRAVEEKVIEIGDTQFGGYVGEDDLVGELDWISDEIAAEREGWQEKIDAAEAQAEAQGAREAVDPRGLLDPKGRVVIETFEVEGHALPDAVVFCGPQAVEPFVVAHGYDATDGEWLSGTYFTDVGYAHDKADPEIIEDATSRWCLDDIRKPLLEEGLAASAYNIQEVLTPSGIGSSFSELVNGDAITSELNEDIAATVHWMKDMGRFEEAPAARQERASGDVSRDNSREGKGFSLESQCAAASKAKEDYTASREAEGYSLESRANEAKAARSTLGDD